MIKRLSKETKFLLIVGMLYLAGTSIAMTFVNVYLVRVTNNINIIIIQNIINYASLLLAFITGTKLISKINIKTILRIGIVSTSVYYLCILLLKENTSIYLIPLGIFNGVGQGLYYFSYNLLTGKLVKENEQGGFFSFQQTLSYIFGVITPSVSGFIIAYFTKLTGYYILFSFAVILFILGSIIACKLSDFTLNNNIQLFSVLRLKGNIYWNTNKYYSFSNGVRESIYNQIFTVFAYTIITNEQIIGNFNSLMAIIGIFSSVFIASKFNRSNQEKFHFIASVVYFISFLLLGITKTKIFLLMAYIVLGIVYCWNSTIFQSVKFQLSSIAKNGFSQYEYIVASEFPIALGRIVGLCISLYLCATVPLSIAYSFLIIFNGSLWLIDHIIIKKSVNWLTVEKRRNKNE